MCRLRPRSENVTVQSAPRSSTSRGGRDMEGFVLDRAAADGLPVAKTTTRDSYGCKFSSTVEFVLACEICPEEGSHHSPYGSDARNVAVVEMGRLLVFARK